MSKATILVIDDEKNILKALKLELQREGYEAQTALSGESALELFHKEPADLAIVDIWLPGMDGLAVLKELKKASPDTAVIMMSGHGTIETAVQATKWGAYDFVEKPVSLDKLLITIERALEFRRLAAENIDLRAQVEERYEMIGQSPPMRQLFAQIPVAAPTDARVLITGENGTGKELVARAVHKASKRAERQFVKVNCAAIPGELIESELFGHEKGAFTDAVAMKKGKFELADGGTIFLDEIGDMSLNTQSKALRVLQEQEFERVGGTRTIKIDVRVIAATNKNLEAEIERGGFRRDLYFRLNVVPFQVPPLRNRREDIPLLIEHYLDSFSRKYGKRSKEIDAGGLALFMAYEWPGNVRELINVVERLVIMAPEDELGAESVRNFFPAAKARERFPSPAGTGPLKDAVREFERLFITQALEDTGWVVSHAAEKLGLERSHLYKKLKALDISELQG